MSQYETESEEVATIDIHEEAQMVVSEAPVPMPAVLTVRKSLEDWLPVLREHTARVRPWPKEAETVLMTTMPRDILRGLIDLDVRNQLFLPEEWAIDPIRNSTYRFNEVLLAYFANRELKQGLTAAGLSAALLRQFTLLTSAFVPALARRLMHIYQLPALSESRHLPGLRRLLHRNEWLCGHDLSSAERSRRLPSCS